MIQRRGRDTENARENELSEIFCMSIKHVYILRKRARIPVHMHYAFHLVSVSFLVLCCFVWFATAGLLLTEDEDYSELGTLPN